MNAYEIVKKAQEDFARLSKVPVDGVAGLTKTDEGWVVSLEALERRAIPDTMDVLGCMKFVWTTKAFFLALGERSCASVVKRRKTKKGGAR